MPETPKQILERLLGIDALNRKINRNNTGPIDMEAFKEYARKDLINKNIANNAGPTKKNIDAIQEYARKDLINRSANKNSASISLDVLEELLRKNLLNQNIANNAGLNNMNTLAVGRNGETGISAGRVPTGTNIILEPRIGDSRATTTLGTGNISAELRNPRIRQYLMRTGNFPAEIEEYSLGTPDRTASTLPKGTDELNSDSVEAYDTARVQIGDEQQALIDEAAEIMAQDVRSGDDVKRLREIERLLKDANDEEALLQLRTALEDRIQELIDEEIEITALGVHGDHKRLRQLYAWRRDLKGELSWMLLMGKYEELLVPGNEGRKAFGSDNWARYTELALKDQLTSDEKKEAKAALNAIKEKYPNINNVVGDPYQYPNDIYNAAVLLSLKSVGDSLFAGYAENIGLDWIGDRLNDLGELNSSDILSFQERTEVAKRANPTAATIGEWGGTATVTVAVGWLVGAALSEIPAYLALSKGAQTLVKGAAITAAVTGYQNITDTETKAEHDEHEQQKKEFYAKKGIEYDPKEYSFWNQLTDVINKSILEGFKSLLEGGAKMGAGKLLDLLD